MTWTQTPQQIADQILAGHQTTKQAARQEALRELLDYVTAQYEAAHENSLIRVGETKGQWWLGARVMAGVVIDKIKQLQEKGNGEIE